MPQQQLWAYFLARFLALQALKDVGQTQEAETAFNRTLALDEPGSPSIGALRIMAQMRQQKGEHADAIRLLDKALAYNKDDQVGGDLPYCAVYKK
jgi:tetratricopeptide (TPR) repeat protein